MGKNLYVGNLAYGVTSEILRDAFAQYGNVTSASVITDRETGRSRGFGFVEMSDGAEAAIEALNDQELEGRRISVNEARPRTERSFSSGRGGGGGGRGNGGGGGYGGGGGGGGGYRNRN